jgi:hypothetical protein
MVLRKMVLRMGVMVIWGEEGVLSVGVVVE